jgi:hypothetical protein
MLIFIEELNLGHYPIRTSNLPMAFTLKTSSYVYTFTSQILARLTHSLNLTQRIVLPLPPQKPPWAPPCCPLQTDHPNAKPPTNLRHRLAFPPNPPPKRAIIHNRWDQDRPRGLTLSGTASEAAADDASMDVMLICNNDIVAADAACGGCPQGSHSSADDDDP